MPTKSDQGTTRCPCLEDLLRKSLGGVVWPDPLPEHARRAAVLVPIALATAGQPGGDPGGEPPSLLLIKRTGSPGYHSRQIAFPGGITEPTDADSQETALRETFEEIGLPSDRIEILGRLPLETTVRNVLVFPWVGCFHLPFDFHPNPQEVERLLFLPLKRLQREGVPPIESPGPYRGESIGLTVDGELVWGLTARILKELLNHLG